MSKENAVAILQQRFNKEPDIIVRAPGRVNLIGEHTDYNDGFVMPAAINREITIAAALTGGTLCKAVSDQYAELSEFDLAEPKPGKDNDSAWSRYISGTAWALQQETGTTMPGLYLAVSSNLPVGSGLSSSAAIEIAAGTLWNALMNLNLSPTRLAELGKKCENEYIGVQTGIMDQMISALGKAGCALLIDCRDYSSTATPIPEELCIVVCDTGKSRELAVGGEYNKRKEGCDSAVMIIQKRFPTVQKLRDATIEMLEECKSNLSDIQYRYAKHVITENERTLHAKDAFADSDNRLIGALMAASHASLREDYNVSCDELDIMVESAACSAHCIGVRMTGAGFGGACVALVKKAGVDEFMQTTTERYVKRSPHTPALIACEAVNGAEVIEQKHV